MKEYPPEVATYDKKGNKEIRLLIDKGLFARYIYMDPVSGKIVEKGKFSIILRNEKGEEEHLYVIPLKDKKALVVWPKQEKKKRMAWSKEKNKSVKLF